jgi:hypothetical protein
VFGNGKMAVKTSLSRYVASDATNFASMANPLGGGFAAGATDIRSWTDLNGDRIPQLNELGPSTNLNFGKPVFIQYPSDDVRTGWGKRYYNWEYAAALQRELLPGMAFTLAYYRRWYSNLTWINNTLVPASDYAPFTFASPLNGQPITLYNLDPAERGLANNVIQFAPNNSTVYNGVDILVSGRFSRGGVVNAGVSMGRTVTSTCTTSNPNTLRFCTVAPPFMAGNQFKFVAAYPLVYGIQVSGTFQSLPGPLILANYTLTSAVAGVPLTVGSLVVNLVQPGTLYGDRLNRVDLRFGKTVRTPRLRLEPYLDMLNLFNASSVISLNNTYGPAWQQPLTILVGRMAQLGMHLYF